MKNLKLIMALLLGSAFLSSCTLQKMLKIAKDQQLEVNPSPLEVHGGKVPFELSAVVPPRTLPKGKVYTINTFYQFGEKEEKVGSVAFVAEEFPNGMTSTSRLSKQFSFPYTEDMNPGQLRIQGVASNPMNGREKSSDVMPLEMGKGLILTSLLVKDVYPVAYADHGYNDKEELIPTNVDFFFDKGRSEFKTSERRSDRASQLDAFVAEKNVTRTVTITGAHSPEGTERVNKNLAEDRAKVIEKYYRQIMRKYDYKGLADSIKFILKPVVEDWTALKDALKDFDGLTSDQKSQITRITNGTGTFEEKEEAISKLSFYDVLTDQVYPPLRVAKTEILTVKEKKTNAEIAVLAKQIVAGSANHEVLSLEELMFSASLTPSLKEKEAIFKAATKKGGPWEAHNNLGAVYLAMALEADGAEQNKKIEEATVQLEIAANKMKAPEVWTNLASAQIMQRNYAQAYTSLTEAEKGGGSEEVSRLINSAKGVIETRNANYDLAVNSLANADDENIDVVFDRGLAYLLKKEFDSADGAFDEVISMDDQYAIAHYTKAIVSARKGSQNGVVSNLKAAVAIDPSLKAKALGDLEFTKFSSSLSDALK